MNDLQKKQLDLLKAFIRVCDKYNLRYFLVGGSALGAVRHKGFIPWDDDIDVVIPREDYNKLISLLGNKKNDKYVLESPYDGNPDYLYSYSKLYDSGTTLTEKIKYPCKRGIYIDVFPLDSLDDDYQKSINKLRQVDRMNMLLMMRTCAIKKERSWYKNLAIILAGSIPDWVIDNKNLSIKLDEMAQKIGNKNSKYVANLMGRYREKEIAERVWFGTPSLHQFEDILIFLPEKYEDYLDSIYGNWNALPPVEKRKTDHEYLEFDLEAPYM